MPPEVAEALSKAGVEHNNKKTQVIR
jgi:hypothetical protein